jgi:hypothetical protein
MRLLLLDWCALVRIYLRVRKGGILIALTTSTKTSFMKKNTIIAAAVIAGLAASTAAYFIIRNRRRAAEAVVWDDADNHLNLEVIAYSRQPSTYKVSDNPGAHNQIHDMG